MDSVTQVVLGASVAAVCLPSNNRRQGLLLGAMLGTLPDLDVLIDYGDAVSNFTYHRGFSHSLFVLVPLALLIWALLRRFFAPAAQASWPWFWAVLLPLVTHPLLDAHTAYGTQLFWPLSSPPVMWSTVFIIDPLYTLPLLFGVVTVWLKPLHRFATRALLAALLLSSSYLVWTWSAKQAVSEQVARSLGDSVVASSVFTTPTPFNSFVWRVVVRQDEQYLEGYYSPLSGAKPLTFQAYPTGSNERALVASLPAVERLLWFSQGFVKTEIIEDQLVVTDLRMGVEGSYVFSHVVAKRIDQRWQAIDSTRLPVVFDRQALSRVWHSIKAHW